MRERPILFSGPMVQAILDGRKTMTRRVMKQQPRILDGWIHLETKEAIGSRGKECLIFRTNDPLLMAEHLNYLFCPYGVPGDRLWVKETFVNDNGCIHYKACHPYPIIMDSWNGRWRPSIFMPRWASRITLEITNVRVGRLQEITPSDVIAEGVIEEEGDGLELLDKFESLWDSINGKKYPWDVNPWVWCISFKRLV